jgi:hypothetical protein
MAQSGMKREDVLKPQIKKPQIKKPQIKKPQIKKPQIKKFLVVPKEHAEIKKPVNVNNFTTP